MKLFYVVTKVRPQPAHPIFWEMQCGYLGVYVYAADNYDAVARSDRFAELLPLDVVGVAREVTELEKPPPDDPFEIYYKQATTAGFAFVLGVATTGCDETGFEQEFEPEGPAGASFGS